MAAYLHPLGQQETAWLTEAMANSGERIDLTGLPKPWVDKHSTGGVGDKTTIVLLPLLAACGLTLAKMSGEGLGKTGGTVDKLRSVPGFRLDLSPEELKEQAARIGVAITGQTPLLAPADKALYSLRNATGTVASVPLIVSSVLSKKMAAGADTIVLDVKCGAGAFMTDLGRARELASWLVQIGKLCGLNVRAAITDMSQPLGHAVGNATEVLEALDVLRGGGPARFRTLCLELGALALAAVGVADPATTIHRALEEGRAWAKASEWFAAQGAQAALDELPGILPCAPVTESVVHRGRAGYVALVDAAEVGTVVVDLGGGRKHRGDAIDHAVGVDCLVAVGDEVRPGQEVFRVHAQGPSSAQDARERLERAVYVVDDPVPPVPLIFEEVA